MNSITEIQDTLDEHKQSLPDSVYLRLCNQMKELYNQETDRLHQVYFSPFVRKGICTRSYTISKQNG